MIFVGGEPGSKVPGNTSIRANPRRRFARLLFAVAFFLLLNVHNANAQTPPTVLAPITISGTVKSGTAGVVLPANLPLSLHVFRAGKAQSNQSPDIAEVITHDFTLSGDSFHFENMTVQPGDLCVVTTTYEGITQGSAPTPLAGGQTTLDLPVTLYAATTDSSALRITQTQQLISFVSKDVMQVLETVDIQNTGDRFYQSVQHTPDGSPISVALPLPIGARAIAFNTTPTTRFTIGGDPNAPIVQDTKPVFPGQLHEIIFSYQLPYSKGAPIDRDYPYLTNVVQVALPAEAGVVVSGQPFTVTQNTTIDPKRPYMQYTLSTPVKAGGRLIYTLQGAARTAANSAAQGLDLGIVLALIGAFVLAGIVGLIVLRRVLSRGRAA